nr:reverse transcriptase domain-containing protein [Tanacetum cinerariifolium]
MSTRSTSSNLFSPLRDPESLIRRRNLDEPSSLFVFEGTMSIPHNNQGSPPAGPPPQNNNGLPPVVRPNRPAPDLQSMEELCQLSINRRDRPIAPIPIQDMDFGLRHHMIQQVQNSYQFHGLPGDDANRHIDKFLEVTQHMKQNGVSNDALRLSLFPYSLMHYATVWYDHLPRNSIQSFDDMMRKFLSNHFPHSMAWLVFIHRLYEKRYSDLLLFCVGKPTFLMSKHIQSTCATSGKGTKRALKASRSPLVLVMHCPSKLVYVEGHQNRRIPSCITN